MIIKLRAWHKTWKEMGKVKRIRFDDDGNVSSVLFKGSLLGVNAKINEIELMQSTGIKDKNGKEIFEGDIITNGMVTMSVKRHGTLGVYMDSKGKIEFVSDGVGLEDFEEVVNEISDSIEILGNIYENPDMVDYVEDNEV